jgi:predicted Rossmann fold flavoprotein
MMEQEARIIIAGGGPAGIFAALSAAQLSNDILVFDGNIKLCRKLSATGNGRCNITNRHISFEKYHGTNNRFVNNVLSRFSNEDLLEWFRDLGCEFKEEEKGRIFPVTDQAATIVDILLEQLELKKIRCLENTPVASAEKNPEGKFVVRTATGGTFFSTSLIIATGGPTYPQLGSTGDGFRLAESFGHPVVPPLPCLVGFEIHDKALFDLQGVQIRAAVTAWQNGKMVAAVEDELIFTHYGLSGPALFDLSSLIIRDLNPNNTHLVLNFFPDRSQKEVEERIAQIWQAHPERGLANSLIGLLPKKLGQVLMRTLLHLDLTMPVGNISKNIRKEIVQVLTELKVNVKAPLSFKEAQVTSGGVSTDKIDPRTMGSQICPGLFFAGEVLDINGDCGGYNLQFAFSSGWLAGLSAAGFSQGSRPEIK